jgi:dTDP-glucose pyrophosphorylase
MAVTWGIVPAAGLGTRIQPLACSKELLPIGTRDAQGRERPCAVSEYLVERMAAAGADRVCFVIAPGKTDILRYYGASKGPVEFFYRVQEEPRGLCDAIFRALPLVHGDDDVLVGLPDTLWYPDNGLRRLPRDELAFLLFPVTHPERFDAVRHDAAGRVLEVQVKQPGATDRWIWGAFRAPGRVMHELFALWIARGRRDEYLGTLVNAWLATGGRAVACRFGERYVDVGTLEGYRDAAKLIEERNLVPQQA